MKNLIFLISLLISNFAFGQLVSPTYFDLIIMIAEDGKDYKKVREFYKKHTDDVFLSTQGIHERLKKPRKSVIYFTEYKKEGKQIALYFSMPFKQKDNELGLEIPFDKKNKRELDFEMFLVNEIRFDLTDLENGTYFIDYSKDLHLMPNSHEVKTTGEGLLIINIPSKTLNKCKISTEFISKENYSESEN